MKAFAVVALASVAMAAPNCDVHAVDKCLQSFIPFANSTSAPASPGDLAKQCAEDQKALKCLLSYSDSGCLKGHPLMAFQHLVADTAKESALRCQEGTDRHRQYFEYISCANKAAEKLNKCYRRSISYAEAAVRSDAKGRKDQACCVPGCLTNCLSEAVADVCPDKKAEVANYFRSIVEGVVGRFQDDIQCGAFKFASEECKALPELPTTEAAYSTLYGPFIDLLGAH